ncbi:hypothetical protein, partial [Streptomyces sp. GbtcB6]|uniref:hypothetical protein n=1 Tax=Streptomyces sp. GbtcB6 TaxID=2824751 RepID=UPI001C2FB7B8
NVTIRNPLCSQIVSVPAAGRWKNFAEFQRSAEQAAALADAYLLAVNVAKVMGAARTPQLHDVLVARPLAEQMLRKGT